jgi:hypothetical protein
MGRASSAKKVQRVAKASGRSSSRSRSPRNLAFPATIVAVVVLGVALVAYGVLQEEEAEAGPQLGDHWHSAVGVYVCDAFVEAPTDQNGDANGIHSHGDNVIHIHPSTSAATKENATLGVFTEEVGIELENGSMTLANGDTFADGDDCNGQPGQVVVAEWPSASDTSGEPTIYTEDLTDIRFTENGMAFTIAFVAEGETPPPPETSQNLAELGAVDGGDPVEGSEVPAVPSTTVPGAADPNASTTTVPAGETTTTTAAPAGG